MNLELHILQNFAPSNLNRDDTGSPKTAEFGGYRRARISSQCLKRAIRTQFEVQGVVPAENRAERTKRLVTAVVERLVTDGREPRLAEAAVTTTLGAMGISIVAVKDDDADLASADGRKDYLDQQKTQYLLYLGQAEIDRLTAFCRDNWDALSTVAAAGEAKGRDAKKAAQHATALSKATVEALKKSLDGGRAADLALFGRMLADLPERNVDAASQVAHALSTHEVGIEFDYYTAVDDRKPDDNAGADMIGQVEFNSACYYRYANIDLAQLQENLGGDADLTLKTVKAFLLANRDAEPTGKQNSFSARNKPSFVLAVVRDSGSWSLANAFAKPVRNEEDLVGASIDALAKYWDCMVAMYDPPKGLKTAWCVLGNGHEGALPGQVPNYREMVETVLAAVRPAVGGA
jgi:CRISPR system Cascade subunit CasC